MQLKKRYSVRKSVAAGAMMVAMFAVSMPAMAYDGLSFDNRMKVRIAKNDDSDDDKDRSGLSKEIKNEVKAIKNELKEAEKLDKPDRSASSTTEVKSRKQCRKDSQQTYSKAVEAARSEREAGLKVAREAYLRSLKAARTSFHASNAAINVSATGAQQVDTRAVRKTYQQAVKKAQTDFSAAKRALATAYHEDVKVAQVARKASEAACKR